MRDLIKGLLVVLLVGIAGYQTPAESAERKTSKAITAAGVLELIEKNGRRPALQLLWDDNNKWDTVWNGIVSGDAEWLRVAVKLRPVSDAGSSEMLHSAVSLALVNAPERVLSLPEDLFPLGASCYYLQFDVPEYGNIELLNRKEKAVRNLNNPAMQDKKAKCLAKIKEAFEEIKAMEGR